VRWLRPDAKPLDEDDWKAPRAHLGLLGTLDGHEALLLLNASEDAVRYTLPGEAEPPWQIAVRTDADNGATEPDTATNPIDVPARAVVLLVRRHGGGEA
jgi:pullulanase/glycogen debranching enzyme